MFEREIALAVTRILEGKKPLFVLEDELDYQRVTIEVTRRQEVLVLVNGWAVPDAKPNRNFNRKFRIRLALFIKRMWEDFLTVLPPGVYFCRPVDARRRRLFMTAGWIPNPLNPGELVFFHRVPPLTGLE